jgi:hypothetical protein
MDAAPRIRSPLLCPLSYGRIPPERRAGEGNRTPITSLEGWGSTVELHPRVGFAELRVVPPASRSVGAGSAVGARGFEPPTPCSQSRCATRLRHAPRGPSVSITKGCGALNYGRWGDGLYLLVEESPAE